MRIWTGENVIVHKFNNRREGGEMNIWEVSLDFFPGFFPSEEVKIGIFGSTSEAVSAALRKTYACKSRTYLRWLMKKEGITESEMLKELSSFRK